METVLAKMLLQIGAVVIRPQEPFVWTSGMKSPIYCDNRLTISYPQVRQTIAKGFAELIQREFGVIDVVAGTATAGIPHAAYVSELLQVPMAYIRSSAKGHGKQNRIEGRIQKTNRVVIIEDLLSTGGSAIAAAQAVQEDAGAEVVGVAAIFSYEFRACKQRFEGLNLPVHTLTNYSALMNMAVQLGQMDDQTKNFLASWKEAPEKFDWSGIGV